MEIPLVVRLSLQKRVPLLTCFLRPFSTKHHQMNFNRRPFNDKARVQVYSGSGGNGCSSFERNKEGTGQPNGGNGGKGGDVYIRTTDSLETFSFSKFHFHAQPGRNGGSDMLNGSAGDDVYIDIPPGTIVREIIGYKSNRDPVTRTIADMNKPGMVFKLLPGAPGGLGNRALRTPDRPKAAISTFGGKGQSMRIELELKAIADIGLVGYPNAGKSTFLSAISRAKPKVASYPFTTLHPTVGLAYLNDGSDTVLSVADIPGLVDGAHKNKGLGHEFLRHIERTKVLLYIVDIARPLKYMNIQEEGNESNKENNSSVNVDGGNTDETQGNTAKLVGQSPSVTNLGDPVAEFESLRKELRLYSPDLELKPSIVFCNKLDSKPNACRNNLHRLRAVVPPHWPIFAGSAKDKLGLDDLMLALASFVRNADKVSTVKENADEDNLDEG